jgi:hypothetical protein
MGVPLKTENEENPGGACKFRVAKRAARLHRKFED